MRPRAWEVPEVRLTVWGALLNDACLHETAEAIERRTAAMVRTVPRSSPWARRRR